MTFSCINCKKEVSLEGGIGTRNRNHCPSCLHSVHLDKNIPGDRKEDCKGVMKPIGITFKKIKKDRFGKDKCGEIMIIHECTKCASRSRNRIASDDDSNEILKIAKGSVNQKELEEIRRQLFGE